nr:hypothetical protein [Tanacetum cinerariifolium]
MSESLTFESRPLFSLTEESQPSAIISESLTPTVILEPGLTTENVVKAKSKLSCPLCREEVSGMVVVDAAHSFMNTKPSEVDPERQRDWRRMERQRDFGDLLSTHRSAFGEDRAEDIRRVLSTEGGGVGLTLFFHVLVYTSRHSLRRSSLSGGSPARAEVTVRRRLTLFFHVLINPSGHSLKRSSSSGGSLARTEVTVRRISTARLIGKIYDGESRDDDNESSDGV